MRTIVVSAVNIRKGGTLTILRQCLEYLSSLAAERDWRVVALVHDRTLCDYPGIEYIEMPDTVRGWGKRLRAEYVDMLEVSRQLAPVDLWFSLHDTTPRVEARRQAVYCQTSFPFMRMKWNDLRFDPKIALFTLFTRIAYRINVHRNYRLVVQAEWLRCGLSRLLGVSRDRFIVFPPARPDLAALSAAISCPSADNAQPVNEHKSVNDNNPATENKFGAENKLETENKLGTENKPTTFLFAATPDCHKNFETLCEAARLLEERIGKDRFRVVFTIDGTENKYSQWLRRRWGDVASLRFRGLMPQSELFALYAATDCLVFPSRVETWGLPISEFAALDKPMLLADLPYAHETSAGSRRVAFFDSTSPAQLADRMEQVITGDLQNFNSVPSPTLPSPNAHSWSELFDQLMATD